MAFRGRPAESYGNAGGQMKAVTPTAGNLQQQERQEEVREMKESPCWQPLLVMVAASALLLVSCEDENEGLTTDGGGLIVGLCY